MMIRLALIAALFLGGQAYAGDTASRGQCLLVDMSTLRANTSTWPNLKVESCAYLVNVKLNSISVADPNNWLIDYPGVDNAGTRTIRVVPRRRNIATTLQVETTDNKSYGFVLES